MFKPFFLSMVVFSALSVASALIMVNAQSNKSLTYSDIQDKKISDGPYVAIQQDNLHYRYVCQNEALDIELPKTSLPHLFNECDLQAKIERLNFTPDVVEYQGEFTIAALSDLHGQFDLMKTLLMNNHIIDAQANWAFADGHFVITGDIFDRGDQVTEILWFLYQLEQQAERAGGKLHLLLGNHEVMVLNGDLRYLHPKYVKTANVLLTDFQSLFTENTVLGRWLRSKSVLVKINNALFAHGGFHPSLAKQKHSLAAINRVFKANLVASEMSAPREGLGRYLHKTNGPIWYRGYFKDNGATAAEIDLLLNYYGVEHVIVGHTSQEKVETRHQGKVIAIDSSIKNGQYGELLLINGKDKQRGTLSGKRLPLN